ncbi:methionine import ATP-binding protein MetN [Actinorhabdospora filicis]|uniref:Methionine import ATP-binding protein MetN n=1 Tax=Actinorhabdospora filicis TaxID=1785913 RepID=A0A9W6SNC4_9ACTN|nr:ATP-binding cassette domain-containing protein [Actinorhabdospora filicis]GLZ80069.1 methionine import ATP-binding protein MetN [Actinorhabdospora filicis]
MIELSDVRKRYRDTTALDGVSLTVRKGEVFGVLGRSGAGKSTLLRTVNALERPDSGSVRVNGVEITTLGAGELRKTRARIGMVFQHFHLVRNRTVEANVGLPLRISGAGRAERKARVAELLDVVGLADKAKAFPGQLSGGQRQRVAIARALAAKPDVLLSDEATSALDPDTTVEILDLLRRLNRELGLTILLITHELQVVTRICDSAAVLDGGRVTETGRVADLLATPGSALGRQAFDLGDTVTPTATRTADITFTGAEVGEPVVAALVKRFDLDVSILDAAVQTGTGDDGFTVGRLRVALPDTPVADEALAWLVERGYGVSTPEGGAR